MGQARNWTKEEEQYLSEMWGSKTVPYICKKLNRSRNAIMGRVQHLQLPAYFDSGEYVTMHQLLLALGVTGGDGYKLTSWVKNRGFPVRHKKHTEKTVKVVYLDEFWEWAEKNQVFLNFANFEENALGLEPEWAKRKRKLDKQKEFSYKTTPWTKADDDYLKGLLKHYSYTYSELSKKLRRTEGAIQRRINDLGIKERPIKADNHTLWTEEQASLLGFLIKQGYHYEAIHDEIPDKSVKAIRGYVFRFYLTESLDKVRRFIGDGEFGDNLPEKQLRHRHVMNPEDKSEVKENLGMFAYILLQRARQLSPVSEEFKDYWQKDMCMNWSDITGCKAGETSCDSCDSFQRIREQHCVRCGGTFFERKEQKICEPCRIARKKQAQRKWAILHSRGRR